MDEYTHGHPHPTGLDVLHDPVVNKGTAFSEEERDALNLRGLVPPQVLSIETQESRVLENFHRKATDLEKYIFLIALQDRNETLFYRTVVDNVVEMMPIIYTPTVGQACSDYGHILRRTRGMYLTARDRGNFAKLLDNWPYEVRVIVVTDGERILGLGDLGANGMGIPIGKLSLYTACAGVHPSICLPLMLDLGTSNEDLLEDPLYIGIRQRRLRGEEYDETVEELVTAANEKWQGVLIQFEDFATAHAFQLLKRYRNRMCCFNDDIQGTAGVALAGLICSGRITGRALRDERLLFLGAGEAAIGIADLHVSYLKREGVDEQTARERCWFVDSKGLVVTQRDDLAEHKQPYAHSYEFLTDLEKAVEQLQPTALIGVSGQPQTFTESVLRAMAKLNDRPVIFALSNPTSKAECTAEQAYRWTDGRAVFASGSPFDPVEYEGHTFVPGQGNNAYIFPGLGLGTVASGARRVSHAMIETAADSLASQIDEASLEQGLIYPPLAHIREVSAKIAVAVARRAYDQGLASVPEPDDLEAYVRSQVYEPVYASYA
jgi:malate dehydrogenase (oxaloacetate-decarboxylating)(NADP+)